MEDGELPASWENTIRMQEKLKGSALYEEPHSDEAPRGMYAGRPIIARDTPINGGVYVGSGAREAIVVDDRKYPRELDEAYAELRRRMFSGGSKTPGTPDVFEIVFDIAKERLGGNASEYELNKRIEALLFKKTGSLIGVSGGRDVKITLNDFVLEGVGVCRHRALLAGYLLERLIRDKLHKGYVSIDRNSMPNLGGHAWVRFEGPNRKSVFIIDPSLGYVGPLGRAPKGWSYQRPNV